MNRGFKTTTVWLRRHAIGLIIAVGAAASGVAFHSMTSLPDSETEQILESQAAVREAAPLPPMVVPAADGSWSTELRRLVARAAGTELEMQGAMTSLAKREGNFTARSDRLDLDELLTVMSGLSRGDGPRSSASTPMNLTVGLTADSGALGGYSFRSLASTIHVTASQVQLRPLRFGIFDGTYDGELRVTGAIQPQSRVVLPTDATSNLFEAVLDATEEALYNSMLQATDTTGNGKTVRALPIEELRSILGRYRP